jgi:hypothetical protein
MMRMLRGWSDSPVTGFDLAPHTKGLREKFRMGNIPARIGLMEKNKS